MAQAGLFQEIKKRLEFPPQSISMQMHVADIRYNILACFVGPCFIAVCDDTCRETILDPSNDLLVCTISGRCFDRWLSAEEEEGAVCVIVEISVIL